MATISTLAASEMHKRRILGSQLVSSESTVDLARKAVQNLTHTELGLIQKTLTDEQVQKAMANLAKNPSRVKELTTLGMTRDICQLEKGLCTLGTHSRKNMPQINLSKLKGLSQHLEKSLVGKINNKVSSVDPYDLTPLQKEMDVAKVVGIAGAILTGKLDPESVPVILADIGSKLYVVDGHHRYAGARVAKAGLKARVIRTLPGVSASTLLRGVKSAPGIAFAGL